MTCAATRMGGWRWRWQRRAGTTWRWSDRPASARRCSPSGCPGCCPDLDDDGRAGGGGDPRGGRRPAGGRSYLPPGPPLAAPLRLGCRGPRGGARLAGVARGSDPRASRRAVPRRGAGVRPAGARGTAPAAGVGLGQPGAQRLVRPAAGAVPAGPRGEPVPVRAAIGCRQAAARARRPRCVATRRGCPGPCSTASTSASRSPGPPAADLAAGRRCRGVSLAVRERVALAPRARGASPRGPPVAAATRDVPAGELRRRWRPDAAAAEMLARARPSLGATCADLTGCCGWRGRWPTSRGRGRARAATTSPWPWACGG